MSLPDLAMPCLEQAADCCAKFDKKIVIFAEWPESLLIQPSPLSSSSSSSSSLLLYITLSFRRGGLERLWVHKRRKKVERSRECGKHSLYAVHVTFYYTTYNLPFICFSQKTQVHVSSSTPLGPKVITIIFSKSCLQHVNVIRSMRSLKTKGQDHCAQIIIIIIIFQIVISPYYPSFQQILMRFHFCHKLFLQFFQKEKKNKLWKVVCDSTTGAWT